MVNQESMQLLTKLEDNGRFFSINIALLAELAAFQACRFQDEPSTQAHNLGSKEITLRNLKSEIQQAVRTRTCFLINDNPQSTIGNCLRFQVVTALAVLCAV
jgi:hypothetical protein